MALIAANLRGWNRLIMPRKILPIREKVRIWKRTSLTKGVSPHFNANQTRPTTGLRFPDIASSLYADLGSTGCL